jgi:nicotinate dehydrogenase subunit B
MAHQKRLDADFTDDQAGLSLTRRELLKVMGGGIIILVVGDELFAQRRGRELPTDFNAFLRVGEDGKVTCFTGKIEMGQGAITSLAQELAEELDVSLDSVQMVMGDTDLCPWDAGTFGSMTTRFFGPPLRAAAAEARAVLLSLASDKLGAPAEDLTVQNGVWYRRSDRTAHVSYAELTKGQRIVRHVNAEVKRPAQFKVIGTPQLRRDAREKVTGEAKFSADIQVPGMLYASILRPPAHGAKLKSVDVSGARTVKGAQVVQDDDLVAALHERPDEAARALAKVKAEFTPSSSTTNDVTIFDHLLKVAPEGEVAASEGDVKKGEARAVEVFERTYLNSYVAHAPIEPHAAVVQIEGGKARVWASTQTPFGAKEEVAKALGIPADRVRVTPPFVGGGFGGKSRNLQVVAAARLAKLTGRPVQVAWTRADEFFDDSFRPAAIVKIRSGLDGEGRIAFWDYHVYYAGTRGAEHFYDIPDSVTVGHGGGWGDGPETHPFATGAWRAPGNNTNTYARESQMDIMAAKAGVDPVQFRLRHLKDEKMRGVLSAAAEKFGWTSINPSPGRGCGVALGTDVGTYVATMAEAEVDKRTGAVQVKRLVAAQNMGLVVNPEGAKIQMEGCMTMGLGYALAEEIHFRNGEVLDLNFDTYHLPRFSWVPQIETLFVENRDEPVQGGGEPAIITMGGVIANAVYAACGARVLQLPMTPERVLAAMKA